MFISSESNYINTTDQPKTRNLLLISNYWYATFLIAYRWIENIITCDDANHKVHIKSITDKILTNLNCFLLICDITQWKFLENLLTSSLICFKLILTNHMEKCKKSNDLWNEY